MHPTAPYLWMLLGTLSFAAMNALSHAVRSELGWQLVAAARAGIMLALGLGLALAVRARLVLLRPWTLWVRSGAGSLGLLLTFYAVMHIPIADAITLFNMTPVWVTLLSWPVLGERPSPKVLAAIAVAFAGVVLIAQPHFEERSLGAAAALVSSVCTATAVLGIHRLAGVDPWAIMVHFSLLSTAVSAGVLFATATPSMPPAGSLLPLLGIGATGTLGQVGLTRAFVTGNPSRVALVGLSQIVFGVLIEAALGWRKAWDLRTVAGMLLVAAPVAFLLVRQAGELREGA